ncbi:cob(I)yrinic acid a,c-diamide adenosyltransferase [Patescibacteria group bacterium]|nr:cob(I)yrinic acid a,c-diamide adenosyltransferase [Patescibacteria group bacterium]MBU1890192.1 cob(I)yrinic acid a,c-diamide adenosyltransferase [Patescibacteria group bacterium]
MTTRKKGITIVYTGNGKGKTTAAMGLALRASAYGFKVTMLQFIKSPNESGEMKLYQKKKIGFVIKSLGLGFVGMLNDNLTRRSHRQAARNALKEVKRQMKRCDVLILDEINNALHGKLITLSSVVEIIKNKPKLLTLVLTGRHAHSKIIKLADLVTEMKEIKHPYQKGVLAQKGIDY